jgi:hypothetical protein
MMPEIQQFSQLSAERQLLVRLCQRINYGVIQKLTVYAGEPILTPAPTVLVDVKLDGNEPERSELQLSDFALRDEVIRLMRELDALGHGAIERIDVRAGVPRRIVLESRLSGVVG